MNEVLKALLIVFSAFVVIIAISWWFWGREERKILRELWPKDSMKRRVVIAVARWLLKLVCSPYDVDKALEEI